jgi:tRNA (guanine10-N2)-dimethyltransferase
VHDRVVLLSGEHPTLPVAELQALLAVHAPDARILMVNPLVARVQAQSPERADAAIGRMALAHEWGEYWAHTDGGEEGLERLHERVRGSDTGRGSIAVRALRSGPQSAVRRGGIEVSLGAALRAAGHDVDLEHPDITVAAWIHGDCVVVARRIGGGDRGRFERRLPDDRAHFSPVTMHPRRAAALVHLAQVAPGGRVLDPFCGTGGIVLEAALAGYDAWGSDRDGDMVQGTLQTLADAGDEALLGTAFVADIGDVPERVAAVDGIVTDMPYGRASSTDGEGVAALYDRAFAAFAALLAPGGRAVYGCADAALGQRATRHGLHIEAVHEEFVHRSLTRHYFVARRA